MSTLFTFDPAGNLTANRIHNESHTVSIINGVDHNYLIPVNAPFFDESMVVIDPINGNALVEDVDFFFAYPFEDATDKVGSPISGAIVLLDPNRSGQFKLNYQTLGGEYVNQTTQAIQDGLDTLTALRLRRWSDIVNLPAVFPPTPHTHRLADVAGITDILAMFTRLEAAILSPERNIHMSDIVDLNEGFVIPIQTALSEVSTAIANLSATRNIHHVERVTDGSDILLTPLSVDQWLPIPISLTVQQDGTYQILFSGNPRILTYSGIGDYEMRYLVDGLPISKSSLTGSYVGLSIGKVLQVEIRVLGDSPTRIQVSGSDIACSLSILKVGP